MYNCRNIIYSFLITIHIYIHIYIHNYIELCDDHCVNIISSNILLDHVYPNYISTISTIYPPKQIRSSSLERLGQSDEGSKSARQSAARGAGRRWAGETP